MGMPSSKGDVINVLAQCVLNSSFEEIKREVIRWSKQDSILPDRLRKVLQDLGGAADFDTQKVANYLGGEGGISASKFV